MAATRITRTAVVQMNSALYDSDANREQTFHAIAAAANGGAKLIILPELVISGYGLDREGLELSSESVNGPTLAAWTEMAGRQDVWIVGGICEKADGKLYNSALFVGPSGLVGHYRKLHLFSREKTVFAPGDRGLPCIETTIGRIGLCVCYDLRFVEVVRVFALQGVQIVAVPTAWVGGFDKNPRDEMGYIGQVRGAMVQANLNQVFIACASQCGSAGNIRFLGSSLIVDPFGEVMAGPMDEAEERIALIDIDLDHLEAAQNRTEMVHPRADRRTDVYQLLLDGTPAERNER